MGISGEADVSLNQAQADDPSMARIRRRRLHAGKQRTQQKQQEERD
jgi:hypothetical protein